MFRYGKSMSSCLFLCSKDSQKWLAILPPLVWISYLLWWCEGADLQTGQVGSDSLTNWYDLERLTWYCTSMFCDRQWNLENYKSEEYELIFQRVSLICWKEVALWRHIERNRNDKDAKFQRIWIESGIYQFSQNY